MRAPKGIGLLGNRPDRITTPGMHSDGGGLNLLVSLGADGKTINRSWIFRYARGGKQREMGLGPLRDYSAADARQRAAECRRLLDDGKDPLQAKRTRLAQNADPLLFEAAAVEYIALNAGTWKSAKHAAQWPSTLKLYAYPKIGHLDVRDISEERVAECLRPIWLTKRTTADRVRGRIETVLQFAISKRKREEPNPARWPGRLRDLLPKRPKHLRRRHHPSLPYADLPAFVADLRAQPGDAADALLFLILTATRTTETIGAAPAELDLAAKAWTIPAERMKGHRVHRVPLSAVAVEIAEKRMRGGLLFPGRKPRQPMSNGAMLALLERMDRGDITPHGFRSTFRTWVSEQTSFGDKLAERALAHADPDEVQAAYDRTDLFERRRAMMDAWAAFAMGEPAGKVVKIKRTG